MASRRISSSLRPARLAKKLVPSSLKNRFRVVNNATSPIFERLKKRFQPKEKKYQQATEKYGKLKPQHDIRFYSKAQVEFDGQDYTLEQIQQEKALLQQALKIAQRIATGRLKEEDIAEQKKGILLKAASISGPMADAEDMNRILTQREQITSIVFDKYVKIFKAAITEKDRMLRKIEEQRQADIRQGKILERADKTAIKAAYETVKEIYKAAQKDDLRPLLSFNNKPEDRQEVARGIDSAIGQFSQQGRPELLERVSDDLKHKRPLRRAELEAVLRLLKNGLSQEKVSRKLSKPSNEKRLLTVSQERAERNAPKYDLNDDFLPFEELDETASDEGYETDSDTASYTSSYFESESSTQGERGPVVSDDGEDDNERTSKWVRDAAKDKPRQP